MSKTVRLEVQVCPGSVYVTLRRGQEMLAGQHSPTTAEAIAHLRNYWRWLRAHNALKN